jgi:hypothetical protein
VDRSWANSELLTPFRSRLGFASDETTQHAKCGGSKTLLPLRRTSGPIRRSTCLGTERGTSCSPSPRRALRLVADRALSTRLPLGVGPKKR